VAHPLSPIPDPMSVCDPWADTVEMPCIAFCKCGTPNTNADMVCDTCAALDADEFGRHTCEEVLMRDTRPIGDVVGCTCGVCRQDWGA
jgi:hypothetical protein